MRVVAPLALLIVAAGCSQETPVNTAQLNRIAFQHNEMVDVGRTARLERLGQVGTIGGLNEPQCSFVRDGERLVYAVGDIAMARIAGTVRNLRANGPIGLSGGFFRDNELALSIGNEPGRPARARVTNRLTEAREEATGAWTCNAQGG